MTVFMESRNVHSSQGIPVTVQSTALVKISNDKSALKKACAIFIGMLEHEMIDFMRETLEGHQRTVIGKMSLEESFFKRDTFSEQLLETAKRDMEDMGLTVLTHKVDRITESSGIIQDILRMKGVEAQAVIRVGEAEARKQSLIQSIRTEEEYQLQQHEMQSSDLVKRTDLQLKKLSNDIEVSVAEASCDLKPELERARNRHRLQNELLNVKLVEAETRVVQEDKNVIHSLSDLVKGVLEAEAQVEAESSLARAGNVQENCIAELEAAAVISGTKEREAAATGASVRPDDSVRGYIMLAVARPGSWQFGQQKQSDVCREEGEGETLKGETKEMHSLETPHSHKVEDNYQTCLSSPADLEAGTSAFLCNEHYPAAEVRVTFCTDLFLPFLSSPFILLLHSRKEIKSQETTPGSLEKVSSPTSLSPAGDEAGSESLQKAAANLPQHDDDHGMENNDDGGRDGGEEDETEATTETWTTFTMDNEEDSLGDEVTEGLETRADDDDEFQDVISHVQDKVSQIMGVNLTNVSPCVSSRLSFHANRFSPRLVVFVPTSLPRPSSSLLFFIVSRTHRGNGTWTDANGRPFFQVSSEKFLNS